MRIAINTSCAVAGGAITHLRFVMPEMVKIAKGDELVMIGDAELKCRIDPLGSMRWHEIPPIRRGLLGRLLFENRVLPQILREIDADVLFHPGNFSVFRSPIPQVNLLHNLAPFLPEVISGEAFYQRVRLRLLRKLTVASLGIADRMIFISEFGRSLVVTDERIDRERMPIIPFGSEHGADASDPSILDRFGVRSDGFILTVSHLYRYKKLEKLVKAYVDLGSAMRDLPLLIVGEPYDSGYAEWLSELGDAADGRIVHTGGLKQEELAILMKACRLFVFTSEAENLPVTLLEAMSAGCVILTNRSCSMPEVCQDAVAYADPPATETYRSEIAMLMEDQRRREDLKARALERARCFRWDSAASMTLDLIRSVGAGR